MWHSVANNAVSYVHRGGKFNFCNLREHKMCCYLAAAFLPEAICLDSLNGCMKEQLECILGKELIGSGYTARNWLRAGRAGDRISVGARFSAPVQTGPGAHPASCTIGTGSFPGVKSGRGVTLTPHSLLVPWSWKSRAIPLLPLWPVRSVQSLSACTRVHFTLYR